MKNMVTAEDALNTFLRLFAQGIKIWLTGGWGIDALLQEETRPHKDLDFLMLLDDVVPFCRIMTRCRYQMKYLWEENSWATDSSWNRVPTAFVLHDPLGRELDAHALRLDEARNGIPAWRDAEDFIFWRVDLDAHGRIAGVAVPCISAVMQMRSHTGYKLPFEQRLDLQRLQKRFGIELPDDFDSPA
jgi:lincosamide nucleotidyltransferase A/C/D/E